MKRIKRDTLLLALIEKLKDRGNWCGETHIQKTTYFLQEMLNVPLEFDFILYKHGPYSFDLSDEIIYIKANGFVEVVPREPYGPSIFPTNHVSKLKELFKRTIATYEDKINFVAEKLSDKKVVELEQLATALYVSLNGEKDKPVELRVEKIHDLKPHISLETAKEAVCTVDEMFEEAKAV